MGIRASLCCELNLGEVETPREVSGLTRNGSVSGIFPDVVVIMMTVITETSGSYDNPMSELTASSNTSLLKNNLLVLLKAP